MAATSGFSAPRPMPAWRQSLVSLWRWWTGELRKIADERFSALRGTARVPVVAFEGEELVLLEPRPAPGAESRVDLAAEPVRARAVLQQVLRQAGEMRGRVRLCLAPGEALVRRVTMPAATEENLGQVLGFEMDRLTPFRSEEVYYDYRVLSRDPAGQLSVQLAVARRPLVDALAARLRELGASVQGVAVRDGAGHPAAPLDLLPSEQRGERDTARERLIQRSLAGAVLVLFLLALLIPLWRKRETIIALQPLLARSHQEAEAADRLAAQLTRQVDDYNYVLARKHTLHPALDYVEEITRLLPDNSWLQQLELKSTGKSREVVMTGETTSSSKLIEILEQSKLLRNAAMRGTITRGSAPNSERFQIQAEAPPATPPEATPLVTAPAAPAPGAPR